jgi:hypothetical protein
MGEKSGNRKMVWPLILHRAVGKKAAMLSVHYESAWEQVERTLVYQHAEEIRWEEVENARRPDTPTRWSLNTETVRKRYVKSRKYMNLEQRHIDMMRRWGTSEELLPGGENASL